MFGQNVGVMMSYMKTAGLLQRGAQVYASRKSRFIDVIPTEDFSDEEPEAGFIGTGTGAYPDYDEPITDVSTDVDEVLKAADEYLEAVNTPPKSVIPIQPLGNYDFASLYGLGSATSEPAKIEPVKIERPVVEPEPVKVEPVKVAPEPVKVAPIPEPAVQATPVVTPQPKAPETPKTQPITQAIKPPTQAPTQAVKPPTQTQQSRPIPTPTTQQSERASIPDITGMNLKTQAVTIARWCGTTFMQEDVLFGAFGKTTILKLVSEGYLVKTKKGILLGS